MNKLLAMVSASIAAAGMLGAAPAMARDNVDWSITVGSGGSVGSVGYPPPVVYSPPPRVVHERVRPVIVEKRIIVPNAHPRAYYGGHRYGHYRDHDRYDRRDWHGRW